MKVDGHATKFIESMFGEKEDGHILVWMVNDELKESKWFENPSEAAQFIENEDRLVNMFVGMGISPQDYGPNRRCLANEVIGIPGLWLDIDIVDIQAHQKQNLPGTIEDARRFLDEFPLSPSLVVSTGHGLHAYWLFREPWYFDNDEEREDAAYLSKRFNYTWKDRAAKRYWDVDSVHDLGRVMRVPGSMNYKSTPVKAKIILDTEVRYNPSDFEQYLVDTVNKAIIAKGMYGELHLDPDVSPPGDKLHALMMAEEMFKQSWEHTRKDMQDTSASAYDMSLANYAAQASWEPQEIVDLLIAHRRIHKCPAKLRLDYMERTLAHAYESINKQTALDNMEMVSIQDSMVEGNGIPLEVSIEKREEILSDISTTFGIKVLDINKHRADPPDYLIKTDRGSVLLGCVENMIKQDKLRAKLAATTSKLLPRFNTKAWDVIAQNLLLSCTEVDIGEEATDEGKMASWLRAYIRDNEIEEDRNLAASEGGYLWKDAKANKLYVFLDDVRNFLWISMREKESNKRLGSYMQLLGSKPRKIDVEIDDKRTSKNCWPVPHSIYE